MVPKLPYSKYQHLYFQLQRFIRVRSYTVIIHGIIIKKFAYHHLIHRIGKFYLHNSIATTCDAPGDQFVTGA